MKKALVAIAISVFTLLLGAVIFWPVFADGHPPRDYSACLSNLKQLAVGNLIYASDNDDRFPTRDLWMDSVEPYVKMNNSRFHCPALEEKDNPQLYGYCFNAAMSNSKLPAKGLPTVPLIFDSNNLARNASGSMASLPSPGRHKNRSGESFSVVAYADGSAKRFPPFAR